MVMIWSAAAEVTLQTVFPFNNCKVQILRKESNTLISFKAFVKSCNGTYVFKPKFRNQSQQNGDVVRNDGKYFRQEDGEVVSTAGELQGATSIAAHFEKAALREDNMSLKSFTFRVLLRQDNSEILNIIWFINLLSVF
jgi:hypothetical protein